MSHISARLRYIDRTIYIAKSITIRAIFSIATFPHNRFYKYNTIKPLNRIATLATSSPDSFELVSSIAFWREKKMAELQFVSIACAIIAGAVIGAFSWHAVESAFWLTHGFWYSSLILSILGIPLSASQIAVLNLLGPLPTTHGNRVVGLGEMKAAIAKYSPLLLSQSMSEYRPRKRMTFTWQAPIMLISYSVCSFLAGLTVLVCSPLIKREGWGAGHNIAIMYLTVCAAAGPIFLFCSFWVYHYVDTDASTG